MRASCVGWISVVYISPAFSARRVEATIDSGPHRPRFRYIAHVYRRLLGQWQSVFVACAARPGAEAASVRQPSVAVLQAGAQVAADAVAEFPRARARAERRRLRGV